MIWEHALPGPRVVNLKQKKLKKTIGEWEIETGYTWPLPKEGMEGEDTDEEDSDLIVDLRESSRWQGRERAILSNAIDANVYDEDAYKAGHLVGFVSDCPPPEILSVCREASEVVSKSYYKVFSSLGSIPTTWICFELDTLYLRYDTISAYYTDGSLYSIIDELTDSGFMLLDMDTLRRVKNLAILKPQNGERQEWENVVMEYSRTMGGLEKLYLVLKDYQEKDDDARSLSIVEPIDVEDTIAAYEQFDLPKWDSAAAVPMSSFLDLLEDWEGGVDLGALEAMLEEDIKKGAYPWKIPKIEEKAVFARRVAEELEEMRSICQMKAAECGL
jgi:2EXR family